jgi:hypothetical protein
MSPGHPQLTELKQRTIGCQEEDKSDRRKAAMIRQAKEKGGNAVCRHVFEGTWKNCRVRAKFARHQRCRANCEQRRDCRDGQTPSERRAVCPTSTKPEN